MLISALSGTFLGENVRIFFTEKKHFLAIFKSLTVKFSDRRVLYSKCRETWKLRKKSNLKAGWSYNCLAVSALFGLISIAWPSACVDKVVLDGTAGDVEKWCILWLFPIYGIHKQNNIDCLNLFSPYLFRHLWLGEMYRKQTLLFETERSVRLPVSPRRGMPSFRRKSVW